MDVEETVIIRVELREDVARKFLKIKERKGLVHNTEVLRVIINEAYEALTQPEKGLAAEATTEQRRRT